MRPLPGKRGISPRLRVRGIRLRSLRTLRSPAQLLGESLKTCLTGFAGFAVAPYLRTLKVAQNRFLSFPFPHFLDSCKKLDIRSSFHK